MSDRRFDVDPDRYDDDQWGDEFSATSSGSSGYGPGSSYSGQQGYGGYGNGGYQGGSGYQGNSGYNNGYQGGPVGYGYPQQTQPWQQQQWQNSEQYQQPQQPHRKRRKKKTGKRVLITLLMIVLVLVAALGGYAAVLASKFNESHAIPVAEAFPQGERPQHAAGDKSVNILLLGNDSRDGKKDAGRTDTMMLMHIPSDRDGVYVTSIMRDTWVTIPGHGQAKINAAYALGKMPLTVATLENLFNVPIDHVMTIDFSGFEGMVDALGGVTIDVPKPFDKAGTHYEGRMDVNGKQALWFVRERYAFQDGDYQRVKNQQQLVKVIFSKMLSPQTILDPVKMTNTVGAMAPYMTRDETLTGWSLMKLGASMPGTRSNDFHFMTLPNKGTGTSADGQSIVIPDMDAIGEFSKAMREGGMKDFMTRYGLAK